MDLAEYLRRTDRAALPHRDALAQAALPSIRLVPAERPDPVQQGMSRLGGLPDLPIGSEWPTKRGQPLSFIAQMNLGEIHSFDEEGLLPDSGLLSFFYDAVSQSAWGFRPDDHDSFAVVYTPAATPLTEREAPAGLESDGVFGPVWLAPQRELTFVPWESFTAEAIGMDRQEVLEYAGSVGGFDLDPESGLIHRLLGYADHVQGDMQVECQLATNGLYCGDPTAYQDPRAIALRPGAVDWRLLLQVDSEEAVGMTWGDVGRIYFWIRRQDLLAREFSRCWLILQCY